MSKHPWEKTTWISAMEPIEFGLSLTGEVLIRWGVGVQPGIVSAMMGVRIPSEKSKDLRAMLESGQTIQETLSAKPPKSGAH